MQDHENKLLPLIFRICHRVLIVSVFDDLKVTAVAEKQAVRTMNLLRCHWYYTRDFTPNSAHPAVLLSAHWTVLSLRFQCEAFPGHQNRQ